MNALAKIDISDISHESNLNIVTGETITKASLHFDERSGLTFPMLINLYGNAERRILAAQLEYTQAKVEGTGVNGLYGDIDTYCARMMEQAVNELKSEKPIHAPSNPDAPIHLGYNHGVYYLSCRTTGLTLGLAADELTSENLYQLCPPSYFDGLTEFMRDDGFHWAEYGRFIRDQAIKVGIFSATRPIAVDLALDDKVISLAYVRETRRVQAENRRRFVSQAGSAASATAPPPSTAKPLALHPGSPLASARVFLARHHTTAGHRTLHAYDGVWRQWSGTHYPAIDDATIRAALYGFLEQAVTLRDGQPEPFLPTRDRVSNVLDALRAAANVPTATAMPAWLSYVPDACPPPAEILPCQNGLLHLPTLELHPHSPTFFNANALDFSFIPNAPAPANWLRFLADIWPNDQEGVDALQDLFGLFLTNDTSHQKIAMIVGPKRSGKGTMARVLTALLGRDNICSPTLASLSTNFGLAPLIGKPLAIIADARLSGRADQSVIAERLLSISGEDTCTADRKYLPAWTGRLPTRFLILTNELPRLSDASGALASRFVILTMTASFYGREDHGLTGRLLDELPGILNWAVTGWQRLQRRGYLVQPQSSAEATQELEDLSSPIGAFLKERCVFSTGSEVGCDTLYHAWINWCDDQGRDHPGTKQSFGRDLRAAIPSLQIRQRRDCGSVVRFYDGMKLA